MPRTREPGRVATGKTIVPPVEATMKGGPPPTRPTGQARAIVEAEDRDARRRLGVTETIGHAEGPARAGRETVNLRTGEKRAVNQEGVIAIDPGDVHCGMALGIVSTNGQFSCVRAWEATPDECADEVAGWLLAGELAAVVVERFSLYADKAATQVGSTMPTAELIGILKYLVRVAGNASLVLQGADIKKSMRNQLKARGVKLLPAEADHARDAQLHLWHYAGRNYLGWGA